VPKTEGDYDIARDVYKHPSLPYKKNLRILPAGQTADSYFSEKSSFRVFLRMGDTLHQSRIKSSNYLIILFYYIN